MKKSGVIGGIVGACDDRHAKLKLRTLLVDSGALRSGAGNKQFVGRAHDPNATKP